MQGKNIINTGIAVAVVVLGAAIFYATQIYLVLLLLPVLALYFDAMNGKYYATAALLVSCSFLAFGLGLAGMLVILMVAVTAAAGLIILKKGVPFFEGMGYSMAAAILALIGGMFAVYLANGRQDLIVLLSNSAVDWVAALPTGDVYDSWIASVMVTMPSFKSESVNIMGAVNEALTHVSAITRAELAQEMLPDIRQMLAQYTPSFVLSSSMIYGGALWYLSNLMIGRSIRKDKPAKGIKEFHAPMDFSKWRMPRWLITTLFLLLLAVFFIELAGAENLYGAAMAVQSVAMAAVSVQGLALVRWYFKKWNLPRWGAYILMAIAILLSSLIVVWIGFIDILFNIRAFTENKTRIKSAMEQMRVKIEEEMQRQQQDKDSEEDSKDKQDEDNPDEDNKQE